MRSLFGCVAAVVVLFGVVGNVGTVPAGVINFDVTGTGNATDVDFYGVSFSSGSPSDFIESIKYTLPVGVFDNISAVPNPNVDLGSLAGLVLADITFDPANLSGDPNGMELTVNFAPGSFGVGDSLRFGYDVDNLSNTGFGLSNADGFGIEGVLVEASLEGQGLIGSDNFAFVDPGPPPVSTAQVLFGSAAAIPEPSTLTLFALGLIALIKRRRRRTA